jgi:hypothetical protein
MVHPDGRAVWPEGRRAVAIKTEVGELRPHLRLGDNISGRGLHRLHFCPSTPFAATGPSDQHVVPNSWDRSRPQFQRFGCQLIKKP